MQLNQKIHYINGFSRWKHDGNNSLEFSTYDQYKNEKDPNQYDYWYIQWHKPDGFDQFPLDTLVPADILDRIRRGEVYLVLENVFEGYHLIAEALYETVILRHDIDPRQVVLVSWNIDLYAKMLGVARQLNLEPVHFEYFNFFESRSKIMYELLKQRKLPTLQKKTWNKKFLCLNRRWRPPRLMLLALLKERSLLDQGHVSFVSADRDPSWPQMIEWMNKLYGDYSKFKTALSGLDSEFESCLPMVLDDHNKIKYESPEMYFTPGMDGYYSGTYFSIVTEAGYERSDYGMFNTEKTWKPVILQQPFVLVAQDHSLDMLRWLGYDCFDSIIDTSYDTIVDDRERLLAVVDEVSRLCSLQGNALESWLEQARIICKKNHDTFFAKTKYIHPGHELERFINADKQCSQSN